MKTQLQRIEEILERDGQISNFQAIHSRWSLRLGARIWDLRSAGYAIATEQQPNKNTIHRLVARPKAEQLRLTLTEGEFLPLGGVDGFLALGQ